MTGKKFYKALIHGRTDIVEVLLSLLQETGADYCIIGGLAVNAYAEPVVSLDLDLVVVADKIEKLAAAARKKGMKVIKFEHSLNLTISGSDLRIQLQTDPRYQLFLGGARRRTVLGYNMKVAALEDVLKGKIWAYSDKTRRPSKRQKDLADIMRLAEGNQGLVKKLPKPIMKKLGY